MRSPASSKPRSGGRDELFLEGVGDDGHGLPGLGVHRDLGDEVVLQPALQMEIKIAEDHAERVPRQLFPLEDLEELLVAHGHFLSAGLQMHVHDEPLDLLRAAIEQNLQRHGALVAGRAHDARLVLAGALQLDGGAGEVRAREDGHLQPHHALGAEAHIGGPGFLGQKSLDEAVDAAAHVLLR